MPCQVLYETVVEVDERVILVQPDCVDVLPVEGGPARVEHVGITGERLVVRKAVNVDEVGVAETQGEAWAQGVP